jgi:hypothetical protein
LFFTVNVWTSPCVVKVHEGGAIVRQAPEPPKHTTFGGGGGVFVGWHAPMTPRPAAATTNPIA